MSTPTIAIIAIVVLGLIVAIVFLLRWLRGQGAASLPEPVAGAPVLLDIHVTYNNVTKSKRMEQWESRNTKEYMDKPTQAQAKLFPRKVTVLYKYNDNEEKKVYYTTKEAVKKLGFLE